MTKFSSLGKGYTTWTTHHQNAEKIVLCSFFLSTSEKWRYAFTRQNLEGGGESTRLYFQGKTTQILMSSFYCLVQTTCGHLHTFQLFPASPERSWGKLWFQIRHSSPSLNQMTYLRGSIVPLKELKSYMHGCYLPKSNSTMRDSSRHCFRNSLGLASI